MRIGVDARPLCSPTSGIGRYTRSLLDRMIPADGNIEWFLYADRPLMVDYSSYSNVQVRAYSKVNHALSLFRTQWKFARWAEHDNVSVFWSPRHHLPLSLSREIRTVLTIHDLVWQRYPETMMVANRLIERILMPRSVARADAITCVSSATLQDLCDAYPLARGKSSVVPLAAERAPGSEVKPETADPYFLFVGTLEPRKNLARLLEAFAMVNAHDLQKSRLVIVGAQGWMPAIMDQLVSLGIAGSVDVLGHVDEDTLHRRLAGAIALCLPSLYEGFGLPAVEAMQYGTPVIGGNVSSIPEVVGEGGLLVDPYSVDEIANAMNKLANDPQLRQALSEKAIAQSARYSWDDSAASTFALLVTQIENARGSQNTIQT